MTRWLLACAALTAVWSLVGLAIVRWWEPSAAGRADADVSRWFAARRSQGRSDAANWGAALSNTETKIALVLALLPLMRWMYRRWHDWTFVVLALLLEVSVFGTASEIVRRDRPPVPQLDGAPTNSWPSGHIAAAVTFYVGIAVVMFTHNRGRPTRAVALALALVAPAAVITARLYQGMHYVSDAVGGALLGVAALVIVHRALPWPPPRDVSADDRGAG